MTQIPNKKRHAREQGFRFYYTGKPCSYGHYSYRYTRTGKCVECEKLRQKFINKFNTPSGYYSKNGTYYTPSAGEVRKYGWQCMKAVDSIKGTIWVNDGFPDIYEYEYTDQEKDELLTLIADKIDGFAKDDLCEENKYANWIIHSNSTNVNYRPGISYKNQVRSVMRVLYEILIEPVPLHKKLIPEYSVQQIDVNPYKRKPVERDRFARELEKRPPHELHAVGNYDQGTIDELVDLAKDMGITSEKEFNENLMPDLYDASDEDINQILNQLFK